MQKCHRKNVSWRSKLVEWYSKVSFEPGDMTGVPIKSHKERERIWRKLDSDILTYYIAPVFQQCLRPYFFIMYLKKKKKRSKHIVFYRNIEYVYSLHSKMGCDTCVSCIDRDIVSLVGFTKLKNKSLICSVTKPFRNLGFFPGSVPVRVVRLLLELSGVLRWIGWFCLPVKPKSDVICLQLSSDLKRKLCTYFFCGICAGLQSLRT